MSVSIRQHRHLLFGVDGCQFERIPDRAIRLSLRSRNHLGSAYFNKSNAGPPVMPYDPRSIECLSDGVRAAFHTVRSTWPCILTIQLMISTVIAAYFLMPSIRPLYDCLIALRDRFGPLFGFFGMGVIVGGLSEVLKVYMQQSGCWTKQNLRNIRFNVCFFGLWGAVSYYKFILYASVLGTGADFQTLVLKSIVDLVLYSAVFYNPICGASLLLRGLDYNFARLRAEVTPLKGYVCRVLVPTQLAHWALWVPLVPIIFILPTPLQLPIVILGVTLWVILLSTLNSKSK